MRFFEFLGQSPGKRLFSQRQAVGANKLQLNHARRVGSEKPQNYARNVKNSVNYIGNLHF